MGLEGLNTRIHCKLSQERTMTVKELIDRLQELPSHKPVLIFHEPQGDWYEFDVEETHAKEDTFVQLYTTGLDTKILPAG